MKAAKALRGSGARCLTPEICFTSEYSLFS